MLLVDYIKTIAPGARVSWLEIEEATGLSMKTHAARNLVRLACRKAARQYCPLPGLGLEFSSVDNANEIAQKAVGAVATAVVRGAHKVANLCEQHLDQMTPDQARMLTSKQAFLSSVAVSTQLARRLPAK